MTKTHIESRILLFGLVLAIGISVSMASAEQFKTHFPVNEVPDEDEWCTFVKDSINLRVTFTCTVGWILDPDTFNAIPDRVDAPEDMYIKQVAKILNETKIVPESEASSKPKPSTGQIHVDPSGKATVLPDDSLENILDGFEKCFGGQEQAYAFQMEYEFEKFVRQYLRDISNRDKLAEECIAVGKILNFSNTAYPGLVVREAVDIKTHFPELHMSKGLQVTPEKLEQEAERFEYPSWYANPYAEFPGKNRGVSEPIISDSAVNQFTGRSAQDIYQEYLAAQAANKITKKDIDRLNKDLHTTVCEIAWRTTGYGGLAVEKWRQFLQDGSCDELLSESFLLKTTNGKFSTLEEARDYRNSLDIEELQSRVP